MSRKSLYDLSLQVTEQEYRENPALSYSLIAKYERGGFNALPTLFDKVESPSLTFGSAVDAIITGGEDEFNTRFFVADFESVPDNIVKIVASLYNSYKDNYYSLKEIPDEYIIATASLYNYQNNWKPETRAKVIREKGEEYYNILYLAGEKTIINTQTYEDILLAVNTLKESTATKRYFAKNSPFDELERFYQLKFTAELNGVPYKCMFDELIVDHDSQKILPIDLKTSCKQNSREWNFPEHYVEWNYQIQNRLYVRILQEVIKDDDYFSDFDILPYRDIIICRGSTTPLIWDIPFTFDKGTLTFGKHKQIEMRDPEVIGQELYHYLKTNPEVPTNIEKDNSNDIIKGLNLL